MFIFLTLFCISRFSLASFPKASAKLRLFLLPTKFFDDFFMLYNILFSYDAVGVRIIFAGQATHSRNINGGREDNSYKSYKSYKVISDF